MAVTIMLLHVLDIMLTGIALICSPYAAEYAVRKAINLDLRKQQLSFVLWVIFLLIAVTAWVSQTVVAVNVLLTHVR